VGQRHVTTRRLHFLEGGDDGRVLERDAADPHALVEVHEMGRAVQAHAVARGEQDRLEHRAGRALAVGSRDDDDGAVEAQPHARGDRPDPLEAEIDLAGMHALQPLEPGGEFRPSVARRDGCRLLPAHRETGAHAVDALPGPGNGSDTGLPSAFQDSASAGCFCRSARSAAISSRMLRRSTIMSIAPFSSRNSARWKPSGSFSRTVCSMTRGPAKPISALGSAMTMSPRKQKLADTPPMVGSVSTEM